MEDISATSLPFEEQVQQEAKPESNMDKQIRSSGRYQHCHQGTMSRFLLPF